MGRMQSGHRRGGADSADTMQAMVTQETCVAMRLSQIGRICVDAKVLKADLGDWMRLPHIKLDSTVPPLRYYLTKSNQERADVKKKKKKKKKKVRCVDTTA